MAVFLVERYLAGWSPTEIESLVDRIRTHRRELEAGRVRHLHSIVMTADETCLCLFEATDAVDVTAVNAALGLPADRVVTVELAR